MFIGMFTAPPQMTEAEEAVASSHLSLPTKAAHEPCCAQLYGTGTILHLPRQSFLLIHLEEGIILTLPCKHYPFSSHGRFDCRQIHLWGCPVIRFANVWKCESCCRKSGHRKNCRRRSHLQPFLCLQNVFSFWKLHMVFIFRHEPDLYNLSWSSISFWPPGKSNSLRFWS